MSRFKKILSILVLAFLLVIAVGCNKKVEKGELVSVTVIIASKDAEISNKMHEIEEYSSAFELMQKYYTITFTRSSFGPYLNTIKVANQIIGEDSKTYYIAFYVNGEYAQVGIGSYYVVKNDTLKFEETKIDW